MQMQCAVEGEKFILFLVHAFVTGFDISVVPVMIIMCVHAC